MKVHFIAILVAFIGLVLPNDGAWANDTFPGTTITGSSGSLVGTNVGSTAQAGEPLIAGGGPQHSMWYTWVAPSSGAVIIGTCNSGNSNTTLDSMLGVYTGTVVTSLTVVATNDDTTGCASTANANYGSKVSFTASAGTTYRILVDGYASTTPTGTFNLYWGLVGFNTTITDSSATEGGDTAAFTLSLTAIPTANVTVTIGTSPQCSFAPTTLTFTPANWNAAQTVTATATDDAVIEGVHSCAPASITATGGGFNTATTTPPSFVVNDNDGNITVVTTDNAATETAGNTGAFTIVLSSVPSATVTVTIGSSPQCNFSPTSLTFTTTTWNAPQTVTATPIDDAVVEGAHTCAPASIAAAGDGYTGATATPPTINITDNDVATVSIANIAGASEPATNGILRLTLTKASATATTISYAVTGTATSATDYASIGTSIVVPANTLTFDITVAPLDDAIVEGAETVIVTLTAATSNALITASGNATNTIADNDVATVSIASIANASEPTTAGTLRLAFTKASATATTVSYAVSGTAISGIDYTSIGTSVVVPANTLTFDITVAPLDDLIVEAAETVVLTLTAATSNGLITASGSVSNTITDNDVASFTISKTVNLANISAPGTLNYTITISSTGNVPLTAPVLSDALSNGSALTLTSGPTLTSGDAAPLGTLDAGETWTYAATYAVSQANINSGAAITNSATFDTAETAPSTSNLVTTTITQNPHLTITKTASTHGPVPVGTVVTYTYTVLNDGNLTMDAVAVADTHNGSGTLVGPSNESLTTDVAPTLDTTDGGINGTWDRIGPGDTVTFTATYTVTQHDVDYLQ